MVSLLRFCFCGSLNRAASSLRCESNSKQEVGLGPTITMSRRVTAADRRALANADRGGPFVNYATTPASRRLARLTQDVLASAPANRAQLHAMAAEKLEALGMASRERNKQKYDALPAAEKLARVGRKIAKLAPEAEIQMSGETSYLLNKHVPPSKAQFDESEQMAYEVRLLGGKVASGKLTLPAAAAILTDSQKRRRFPDRFFFDPAVNAGMIARYAEHVKKHRRPLASGSTAGHSMTAQLQESHQQPARDPMGRFISSLAENWSYQAPAPLPYMEPRERARLALLRRQKQVVRVVPPKRKSNPWVVYLRSVCAPGYRASRG